MNEERKRLWRSARRILAVRLDNLGDVLMTTPALVALRRSLPEARITLLASPAGAALRPHLPVVDEVIEFRAPWVKHEGGDEAPGLAEARLLERLAAERFDAAIIFTVCTQSALPAALMCRLAGIGLRLAYARENPYRLLTDWVVDRDTPRAGGRHEVRRQLDLLRSVGFEASETSLQFACRPQDNVSLLEKLAGSGANLERSYIVVHPGASAPSRRYPAVRFGEAAARVARETGSQLIVVAGPSEAAQADEVVQGARGTAACLTGALSLGELAALIGHARLVLCNNSAPAHLAAALGTPVVVPYALTNAQHTPWRVPSRVLYREVPCRDCLKSVCPEGHHACLLGVSSEQVAAAALELLVVDRPAPAVAPLAAAGALPRLAVDGLGVAPLQGESA